MRSPSLERKDVTEEYVSVPLHASLLVTNTFAVNSLVPPVLLHLLQPKFSQNQELSHFLSTEMQKYFREETIGEFLKSTTDTICLLYHLKSYLCQWWRDGCLCGSKWEDLILSVCVINNLVEKGVPFFPVPKFFPFLFVSRFRLLPSSGDAQWNIKDSVMSLDEDDPPGHKVSIRYLGKGDCAAANTSVKAPKLEQWETLQQHEPWVLVGSPGLCAQCWGWAAPKAQRETCTVSGSSSHWSGLGIDLPAQGFSSLGGSFWTVV